MAKFTIELPDSHVVSSRSENVSVDVSKIPEGIIAKLVLHGLTQKVGDSAASALKDAGFSGTKYADLTEDEKAKVAGIARESMEATRDQILAGEWTARTPGAAAVDPVTARVRKLFGAELRSGAKAVWETVKELEPADRGPRLDELFATQADDYRDALTEAAKAELKAEATTRQKLGKLTIAIKA